MVKDTKNCFCHLHEARICIYVFWTYSFRYLYIFLQEWVTQCKSGNLLSALQKHWKTFALVVFSNNYDSSKEDRLAEKFLLRPMEFFLCNGDPEVVMKNLKEKDQPSQLCGKVFKNGEPTYSCRYIVSSPTCILLHYVLAYICSYTC